MEITTIVRTCIACPSQWQGRLNNEQYIYIRYRWSNFTIGVGDDLFQAISNTIFSDLIGDSPYEGWMTNLEMMNIILENQLFTFSDEAKNYLTIKDQEDVKTDLNLESRLKNLFK